MEAVSNYYNWIVNDLGDPRVKEWILANQPWPLFSILCLYTYLIKVGLPMWMKDRKAYDLKKIIQTYNLILLLSNIGIVYRGLSLNLFHMRCEIPKYSTEPNSLSELNFIWFTLQVKLLELIETMFYVLRKKPEQASFLHIYHHVFVIVFMWLGLKYFGGGMAGLPIIVNCSIHVIMYSYYYLASISDSETRKKLTKFKKTLTMIQIVQFLFIIFHVIKSKYDGCPLPNVLLAMFVPFVFSIFLLFVDFFKTCYGSKNAEQFQKSTKMM